MLLHHMHRACWERDLDATFIQAIVDPLRHFQLLVKLLPIIIHPHPSTHVEGEIAHIQEEHLGSRLLQNVVHLADRIQNNAFDLGHVTTVGYREIHADPDSRIWFCIVFDPCIG